MTDNRVSPAIDENQLGNVIDIGGGYLLDDSPRLRFRVLDNGNYTFRNGIAIVIRFDVEAAVLRNRLDADSQLFFKLAERYEITYQYFVVGLEPVSAQPTIDSFPDCPITSKDIPSVTATRVPVAVIVLGKCKMPGRIRTERS